jgi:hypothetical protein
VQSVAVFFFFKDFIMSWNENNSNLVEPEPKHCCIMSWNENNSNLGNLVEPLPKHCCIPENMRILTQFPT